jgi:hypothetical protein
MIINTKCILRRGAPRRENRNEKDKMDVNHGQEAGGHPESTAGNRNLLPEDQVRRKVGLGAHV